MSCSRFPAPRIRIVLNDTRVIQSFDFEPRMEETDRILRRKAGFQGTGLAEAICDRIRSRMHEFVHSAAIYGLFNPSTLAVPCFEKTDAIGFAVVTIGSKIDIEMEDCLARGDVAEAVILDALGSAYAEGAAVAVNQTLIEEGRMLGYHAGPRRSPGFGRWQIEAQFDLLRLLNSTRIQVRLSESGYMIPQKSVSFAVPFVHSFPNSNESRLKQP